MRSRRFVVGCALCAVGGLLTNVASGQASGLRRKVLMQADGPSEGFVTMLVEIEIDGGFMVARHTHPGIESSYVSEGGGTLMVDGMADRELKPGDGFQIPTRKPHALKNGGRATKVVANYIVEKGQPLASPA